MAQDILKTLPDLADLKEAERPKAPPIKGATDAQRAHGRQLAAIHRMHLIEMAQIRQMIGIVEKDTSQAKALSELVGDLTMTRNLQTFGAMCGQKCNHLLFHHDAEEQHTFPTIAHHGGEGLRAVIAKLQSEHEVIHHLLEALGHQAIALHSNPSAENYALLKEVFERLDRVIRSHFGYEETELEEAIGVYNAL